MDSQRQTEISHFLTAHQWQDAQCVWLDQDASTRRYARLRHPDGRTSLLMDSPLQSDPPCPPDATEDERIALGWHATARLAASRVDAYVLIAGAMSDLGLSTPTIYAHDKDAGFCLLEDFGADHEFAAHLAENPHKDVTLYNRAIDVLAHIHTHLPNAPQSLTAQNMQWPLLEFDALTARVSMDVFYEWYVPYADRTTPPVQAWETARNKLVEQAMALPRSFCFRDYHSQNLLWLPDREGLAQVGLLDFQDAIIGWDVWDLDLCLRDARFRISSETREAALTRYCALTGKDKDTLRERWAIIGTLNAIRIIGVYARLITRDNRAKYAEYMPQQIAHLNAHLAHPTLKNMRGFFGQYFGELVK